MSLFVIQMHYRKSRFCTNCRRARAEIRGHEERVCLYRVCKYAEADNFLPGAYFHLFSANRRKQTYKREASPGAHDVCMRPTAAGPVWS